MNLYPKRDQFDQNHRVILHVVEYLEYQHNVMCASNFSKYKSPLLIAVNARYQSLMKQQILSLAMNITKKNRFAV